MRTIGLIGGMSWESSAAYYRLINQETARRLGGLHSARSLLYSVDFAEVEALQHQGRWDEATALMVEAARRVERGGADLVLLCTNTMHRMADAVQAGVGIPLLHIADATGACIHGRGLRTVGLLGTRFTMEQDFYRGRLARCYGLAVLIPEPEAERQVVHDIIYDELCRGEVRAVSREAYRRVIGGLVTRGAQGIVLGCTEIMLLIGQEDSPVPVFDTTSLHAHAAVEAALAPVDAEEEDGAPQA
jgi:aspartate racemase